ncbi:MAG: hypothetical protein ACRES9_06000 [Gammaproteobacteria bacterium]
MKNILLLRVGIDSGCGGTLAPIFPDGTFEYIPIPENPKYVSSRSVYFRDLPARHSEPLTQYVPRKFRDEAAHLDPEFDTFTYGDPGRLKRSQLLRLVNGDMLVFYAGLRPPGARKGSSLYVIGYFDIASVKQIEPTLPWPPQNMPDLAKNAHLRRNRPDQGLVVVSGHAERSRLFDKAIAISDETGYATPETEMRMGIRGSLRRAIGRWVPSGNLAAAHDWITRSC